MRTPDFWKSEGPLVKALAPLGKLYGAITAWRLKHAAAEQISVPVISVGNLTVGGTGKTPVVRDLVKRLKDNRHRPAVVLRGYGGHIKGPLRVDTETHTALDVGDEALLHARDGATWVARKRADGAKAAIADGATVIVLDDAHQHTSLKKDYALLVVDGAVGFGNHHILPAGPLREDVRAGLGRADAIIILGKDETDLADRLPDFLALAPGALEAEAESVHLHGRKVVAFAGLGRPQKFFDTLADLGAVVVAAHPFDDHHLYKPADIQLILDEAFGLDALPVTTEKDAMRLAPDHRQQVNVLRVAVRYKNPAIIETLLQDVLSSR
ncbi:MAG: tetraacyldisaccharide 4'-kinase [Alphaproteobacteria bacterium]|nr:tetraacyldisaccharide 4'-kinase [Alphaproteobacteria bacterium]